MARTPTLTRVALPGVIGARFAGDAILAVTPEGLVRVGKDDGVEKVPLALKYPGPIAVTPDHRWAFVGDGKKVVVVDLASFTETMRWTSAGEDVCTIAPSPDGRRVVVVGIDEGGTLKCFEVGQPRARFTIYGLRYARAAWVDDRRFVTAHREGKTQVRVYDADDKGAVVVNVGEPGMEIHDMFVVDGVASCVTNKGLSRLPLVVNGARERVWKSTAPLHGLVRDADGRGPNGSVFVAGDDGVHRVDAVGNAARVSDGNVTDIDATRDGTRVAFTIEDALIVAVMP